MAKKKPVSDIFIELLILVVLIPTMFSLSTLVGFGYLFAFIGSLYSKALFRKKFVVRLIVYGSILTYVAGAILLYGFNQRGDIFSFVLIMVIGFWIWYAGFRMKRKGRRGK